MKIAKYEYGHEQWHRGPQNGREAGPWYIPVRGTDDTLVVHIEQEELDPTKPYRLAEHALTASTRKIPSWRYLRGEFDSPEAAALYAELLEASGVEKEQCPWLQD